MACQSHESRDRILSQEEMVEVLYEQQLAQALARQEGEDVKKSLKYRQAVFYQHKITEADFNRSLAYYSRRTDEMKDIYALLQKRYHLQGDLSAAAQDLASTRRGDTLRLWSQEQAVLEAAGQNRLVFVLSPRRQWKKGERLVFAFDPEWHDRQGQKQAWATMAVTYANDSTESRSLTFSDYPAQQSLEYVLDRGESVKQITLQIYHSGRWQATPQYLRCRKMRLSVVGLKDEAPSGSQKAKASPTPAG